MIEARERRPLPARDGQGHGLLLWGYDRACCMWVLARWLPAGVEGPVPDAYAFIAGELLTSLPGVERYRLHLNHGLPARAFDGPPENATTFTCPDCWTINRHPDDVRERRCGRCKWWTDDRELAGENPAGTHRSQYEQDVPRVLVAAEWEGLTREGLAGQAAR